MGKGEEMCCDLIRLLMTVTVCRNHILEIISFPFNDNDGRTSLL